MMKIFDNKVFKVLFSIVKTVLIVLILAYLSFITVQRLSGNKSIFGYRLFTVATGSMIGVYNIDDVIAVKDCDINSLKVGDDIAYQGMRGGLENKLITHRIIKIEDNENGGKIFYTQGVNSKVADPSITDKQVLGKVVGVVPVITQINHVVKSQSGFFLLIFCPLVIIIVLEVLQTIVSIKLEKKELVKIADEKNHEDDEEKEDNNSVEETNDDEFKEEKSQLDEDIDKDRLKENIIDEATSMNETTKDDEVINKDDESLKEDKNRNEELSKKEDSDLEKENDKDVDSSREEKNNVDDDSSKEVDSSIDDDLDEINNDKNNDELKKNRVDSEENNDSNDSSDDTNLNENNEDKDDTDEEII